MNNRYYVMRHGESTANRQNIIVSHADDALNDYGLTSSGVDQVTQVAIRTRLRSDTIIISSDFLRARETATIVQKVIDTKSQVQFFHELRERSFGNWNLTDASNYKKVWDDDLEHPHLSNENIETTSQVLTRTISVIDQMEANHKQKTILIVGHGDVLQILMCHFYGIDVRFHRSLSFIKNAEIRSLPNQIQRNDMTA